MSRIIQNALYFPEHDYYMPSTFVHDYRTFEYRPGFEAMVDGGKDYIRRGVTPPEHAHLVVPFDLGTDDSPETIREKLLWGSLPLDLAKPRVHTYRPICTLTRDHLKAILKNCPNAGPLHRSVVAYWLEHKSHD